MANIFFSFAVILVIPLTCLLLASIVAFIIYKIQLSKYRRDLAQKKPKPTLAIVLILIFLATIVCTISFVVIRAAVQESHAKSVAIEYLDDKYALDFDVEKVEANYGGNYVLDSHLGSWDLVVSHQGKTYNLHAEGPRPVGNDCSDDFQKEQITADYETIVNDLIGQPPLRATISYHEEKSGGECFLHQYYDGEDVIRFLNIIGDEDLTMESSAAFEYLQSDIHLSEAFAKKLDALVARRTLFGDAYEAERSAEDGWGEDTRISFIAYQSMSDFEKMDRANWLVRTCEYDLMKSYPNFDSIVTIREYNQSKFVACKDLVRQTDQLIKYYNPYADSPELVAASTVEDAGKYTGDFSEFRRLGDSNTDQMRAVSDMYLIPDGGGTFIYINNSEIKETDRARFYVMTINEDGTNKAMPYTRGFDLRGNYTYLSNNKNNSKIFLATK
jgi:hypothetical protein